MISVKKSAHTVKLNLSVGTHYTVHKKHLVNSVGFAVINKIMFEISEIDNMNFFVVIGEIRNKSVAVAFLYNGNLLAAAAFSEADFRTVRALSPIINTP